jgi:hypothetical protein
MEGEAMKRRDALKTGLAAFGFGSTALPLAAADEPFGEQPDERNKLSKIQVRETVLRYLAAWNERDAKRRLELVAHTWAEDGSYVDHARQAREHESISAMIAKAQIPYPGYRTALASGIETHHEYVRFSWVAGGVPDTPLYIKGTDVGIVAADGRFKAVIGFVDAAP